LTYRAFFRLALQRIDPERAHALAIRSLRLLAAVPGALALLHRLLDPRREGIGIRVLGLDLATPLGVAAGLDKDATAFDPLLALGFGAVEVGTVTARPQPGNPRPRASRLPRDRALLNAMGFPSEGAEAVARRLARRRVAGALGVNVGKSREVALEDAVADYRESARLLAPHADYLVLNVSSPNTPELRRLQAGERLRTLVEGVREELGAAGLFPSLLVKLAPDLDDAEIEEIAALASRLRLDGIVAVNTTTDHEVAPRSREEIEARGHGGGVSGPPLQRRALEVLDLLRAGAGDQLPLISVGGIETAEDAWERILRGASLVQAYTGFVYGGPLWPRRVNRGLGRLLRESGYPTIAAAVGQGDLRRRSASG
jgi:dihydroorotate dehydrogenase